MTERDDLLARCSWLTGFDVVDVRVVPARRWGRSWVLVLADGRVVKLGGDRTVRDWQHLRRVQVAVRPERVRMLFKRHAHQLLDTMQAIRRLDNGHE